MQFDQAEVQLLATLFGAENTGESTEKVSLQHKVDQQYRMFREDLSGAYDSLTGQSLIIFADGAYSLADEARPIAEAFFHERPDYYWYFYQHFYAAADASAAHSEFCAKAFGMDLCQEGMMDMDSIWFLLDLLKLQPEEAVVDLGCGAGGISRWISETTHTHVTGIDYSKIAIKTADSRTKGEGSRVTFREGDLNTIELPDRSFDAAILIDSIYWVEDKKDVLERIIKCLKPGGRLAIVIAHSPVDCEKPEEMEIDKTYVASALNSLGIAYECHDTTEAFASFWPRANEVMLALKDDFESEGNGYIAEHWLREADEEFLPALAAGELRRYLYVARV